MKSFFSLISLFHKSARVFFIGSDIEHNVEKFSVSFFQRVREQWVEPWYKSCAIKLGILSKRFSSCAVLCRYSGEFLLEFYDKSRKIGLLFLNSITFTLFDAKEILTANYVYECIFYCFCFLYPPALEAKQEKEKT